MGNLIIETGSETAALNQSADNMLLVSDKTNESAKTIREAAGFISEIAGLSDIAESNVTNAQETNGVITDMSERFKEVKQSAVNLRGTADILERNIRNFKM